jgi:hypothetical protein
MPWTLQMSCACGRTIAVNEGSPGIVLTCPCARKLEVPPFKRPASSFPEARGARTDDDHSLEERLLLIVGLFVLGTVFLSGGLIALASARLWVTGYAFAVAGQIWLVFLIVRECHPEAVVWSLLVPGFTWCFAYQRWDIAKWPLACNVGGLILLITALFAG